MTGQKWPGCVPTVNTSIAGIVLGQNNQLIRVEMLDSNSVSAQWVCTLQDDHGTLQQHPKITQYHRMV